MLNPAQPAALAQVIEDGPLPAIDDVVRWRLVNLAQWVFETFRISISRQTLGRELPAMNYRKLSARPRHHAQAAGAVEAFKTLLQFMEGLTDRQTADAVRTQSTGNIYCAWS